MGSIMAQASTLLAVVVGGSMTYLITSMSDRARWRRERSARWDVDRMEAYFAYAHATKASTHVAIRVATTRGLGSIASPLPVEEGMSRLSAMEVDRGALWEKVLLLGDPDTIRAGREWHEHVWQLGWFAEGRFTDAGDWATTVKNADGARHRFYESARKSLEVSGADLPVAGWTRRQQVYENTVRRQVTDEPAGDPETGTG
jgi:hypothetical protein